MLSLVVYRMSGCHNLSCGCNLQDSDYQSQLTVSLALVVMDSGNHLCPQEYCNLQPWVIYSKQLLFSSFDSFHMHLRKHIRFTSFNIHSTTQIYLFLNTSLALQIHHYALFHFWISLKVGAQKSFCLFTVCYLLQSYI